MKLKLILNGKPVEWSAPGEQRLSSQLRIDCRGIQQNCGGRNCGCCLILLNELPVYSCQIPFFSIRNKSIRTIDGIIQDPLYQDITSGLKKGEVNICDSCAPSRVLSFFYLLSKSYNPGQQEIEEILHSVNCNCSSYQNLKKALYYSLENKLRRVHG